jgi:hypothetical protein
MTNYNVLIVYDVEGWAYHFEAEALKKYAPQDFSVTISPSFTEPLYEEDYHLVYFLPFSHVDQLRAYCDQIGKNPAIRIPVTCPKVSIQTSSNARSPSRIAGPKSFGAAHSFTER